jgi:nucleotide-binding universal stress UspA family protein
VATDGSPAAARAVACAAELSRALGRDLSIVHVQLHGRPRTELERLAGIEGLLEDDAGAPPGPPLAALVDPAADEVARARLVEAIGSRILARAASDAAAAGARNIRIHASAGDCADEILDMAEAEGAGMIVLGRRGLGRLRGLLLGSVTQKVLHATDATVVIVP